MSIGTAEGLVEIRGRGGEMANQYKVRELAREWLHKKYPGSDHAAYRRSVLPDLTAFASSIQAEGRQDYLSLTKVHREFLRQVRKAGVKVDLYSLALQTDLINERAESAEQQLAEARAQVETEKQNHSRAIAKLRFDYDNNIKILTDQARSQGMREAAEAMCDMCGKFSQFWTPAYFDSEEGHWLHINSKHSHIEHCAVAAIRERSADAQKEPLTFGDDDDAIRAAHKLKKP